MMIDFKCPKCGEQLSVPSSLAGQTTACPQCGNVAVVPKGEPAPGSQSAFLVDLAKAVEETEATGSAKPTKKKGGIWSAMNEPLFGAKRKEKPGKHSPGRSNLKQCPECKEWIDKSATKCPHCRSTQPPAEWATVCGTVVAVIIVLGLGLWGYRSCSSVFELSPETEAKIEKERRHRDRYGDKVSAWVMAQDFVKKRLVSPGSADFGGWLDQIADDCVTDLGEGEYIIKGWVDSQNKFGAKLRSHFTCRLKYVGNDKWQCESMDLHER